MQLKSILLGLISAGLLNAAPLAQEPTSTAEHTHTPHPKPTGSISFTFTGTHTPHPRPTGSFTFTGTHSHKSRPTGSFSFPAPSPTPAVLARQDDPSATPSFSFTKETGKKTHTRPTGRPTGSGGFPIPTESFPHPTGTGKSGHHHTKPTATPTA